MGLFKKSKKEEITEPIEVVEPEPKQDNNEIIAVISAAVAEYLSELNSPKLNFRVVSFRKVNNNWRT